MRKTWFIAVVLLTVMCGEMRAGTPEYVFPTTPAAGRQFPGLDKMSDGTFVLVYAERSGNSAKMFVCTSTDDGVTWSHPRSFGTVQTGTLGLQRRPRVQIDRDGVIHAVFEDLRGSQTIHVYHCSSTDKGLTWTMPMPVADVLVSPHEDFCSAAIDSNNRLVVTYLSAMIDATDELVHVYMVTTTDKGKTWSDPTRVDRLPIGGACECCQQNVTISPNGTIAVGYRSNINNKRDVHVAISTDNGTTFTAPIDIQTSPWNINQCPTTGPTLCFDDNETLHISWWDARDVEQKAIAYYAKLLPGATTTPANLALSKDLAMETEYPCVTTSKDGQRIFISFISSTGLYLSRSTDGGQSFTADKVDDIFMNNASAFSVLTRSGYPLTMWQATRGSLYDVIQYRDDPTSVAESNDESIEIRIDAGGELHVSADAPIASVQITDLLGRQATLPTNGLVVIRVQLVGEPLRYRCEVFSLYR